MFEKLSNSWELAKASGAVLMADKELLIFPAISAVAAIIISLSFLVPIFATDLLYGLSESGMVEFLGFIITFLFYAVLYTATFFFNSALVGAAMIRLNGGDPTVKDGFDIARKHIGPIVGYGIIAATVGTILKAVSEKSGALGQFVISLIGLAWSVATFLVVPVLVVEGLGPLDAIKRSTELLKQTWGEQIAGNFGLSTVFGLIFLAVLVGEIFLFVLIGMVLQSEIVILVAIVTIVLSLVAVGLVQSALTGIYTAAVYQYATTGKMGNSFDPELIKGAFKTKN